MNFFWLLEIPRDCIIAVQFILLIVATVHPCLLCNFRNYSWMTKPYLLVKQICLSSIISNHIKCYYKQKQTLNNCWLSSFQKPVLQSISIFFNFFHPWLLLYWSILLCYFYLLLRFWLFVSLNLVAVPTVWILFNLARQPFQLVSNEFSSQESPVFSSMTQG